MRAQFLHDVLAVRHRRLDADVEERGDFLVAAPLGHQLEDLLLAIGQPLVPSPAVSRDGPAGVSPASASRAISGSRTSPPRATEWIAATRSAPAAFLRT